MCDIRLPIYVNKSTRKLYVHCLNLISANKRNVKSLIDRKEIKIEMNEKTIYLRLNNIACKVNCTTDRKLGIANMYVSEHIRKKLD